MENGGKETKNRVSPPPHVVMLPTHGMGHLIPMAELAKRLVIHHGFAVTILTFASSASKAQAAFLSSLPPSISSQPLPSVPVDDIPSNAPIETIMSVNVARSLPALRVALSDLKSSDVNYVAFVTDLFGSDTFDVARELGMPPYMFFPSNLLNLSILLHLPELDAATTCEFRDLLEPVQLPGCVPIPGPDVVQPLQDRSDECYKWMLRHGSQYKKAEGIMVNTFDAIEPDAAKVIRQKEPGRPPVYLIGPLIQTGPADGIDGSGCLEWLDQQPTGSVLFVSFGSGGTLSTEQMRELALGLENSKQRFLWVVRSPSDTGNVASAYFSVQSKEEPLGFLPAGFVDRTRDVGLLVSSWAPQVAVLNHSATGGFLSHCGWNSTLESVVAGVAMVAWPLYAEQRQNAVMLEKGAKVALRVRPAADGVVQRKEVERVVRELMEGDEGKAAKKRVLEIRAAAEKGLQKGGAAYEALAEVANEWKELSK